MTKSHKLLRAVREILDLPKLSLDAEYIYFKALKMDDAQATRVMCQWLRQSNRFPTPMDLRAEAAKASLIPTSTPHPESESDTGSVQQEATHHIHSEEGN